jgi:hypothetical protein
VKATKHLAYLLTTDWQRERQALDYLYLILSFRVANFLFTNSQNTQPHFITGMNANVFYFCSFCKPTFSGATREWDALYNSLSHTAVLMSHERDCRSQRGYASTQTAADWGLQYTLHMRSCNVPRNYLWYEALWALQHTHCQFRKFETCSNEGWLACIAKSVQRQATGSMVRVRLLAEARDFLLLHSDQINCGDHLNHQSISWKEKWPAREGDHSIPSSDDAMNGGVINPLHHTASWC